MSSKSHYDKLLRLLTVDSESKDKAHLSKYRTPEQITTGKDAIASFILTRSVPESDSSPSLRPRIWKIMLNVEKLNGREYLEYVSMGPSPVSNKIKNDTFRTLATDTQFKGKVKEDMLIRLLEAFVNRNTRVDRQESGLPFSYVQGMNVLAAPFLYVMPSQVEAFACFTNFIEKRCPLYVQPTLVGVHRGLRLLDRCLQILDTELYDYLRSKNLSAEIYAFPSVLTLCACTPPLEQVLKLWDYLLACGVHLNILCVVAQVLLMKEVLLETPSPMSILRNFPPLEANPIISMTTSLVRHIPEDLYNELVEHPYVL